MNATLLSQCSWLRNAESLADVRAEAAFGGGGLLKVNYHLTRWSKGGVCLTACVFFSVVKHWCRDSTWDLDSPNSQTVMPIGLNPIGRAVEGWFWLYLRRLQSPPRSLERILALHISQHGPPHTMSFMYLTRGTKLLVPLTSPDCSEEPKGDWTQDSSVQLKTRHANRVEPDWQSCFGLVLAILDRGYNHPSDL